MVLKFCSALFSPSETPASSSTSSSGAATTSEERIKTNLKKKALEAILLDAQDAKWEKELRVFFDGTRATGLGFRCASNPKAKKASGYRSPTNSNTSTRGSSFGSISTDPLGPQDSCDDLNPDNEENDEDFYQCLVKEILPNSLAAEYNARCRGIGDYSRLIRENLRVRKVNSDDVAGIPYDQVIQKMRAAIPAFFLTFADISSKRMPVSKAAKASLEAPSGGFHRRQSSSMLLLGSGGPPVITRRNSSIGLSAPLGGLISSDSNGYSNGSGDALSGPIKRTSITRRNSTSSVVLLHGGGWGTRDQNNGAAATSALVIDLELKTKDVSDQLLSVKQQMVDLQREKDQIALEKECMTQERDAIAAVKEKLEIERLKLFEERDAVITKNKLLSSQRQFASDLLLNTVEQEQREAAKLKNELDVARNELAQLQQAHSHLLNSQAILQSKMVDQARICEETSKLVDDLHHEKEELSLACKELQLEHSDSSHHVEELHSRLVEAQAQQKAAEKRLGLFSQELNQKTKLLEMLKQGIEAAQSTSSELDQLLLGRRGDLASSSTSEVAEHLGLLMHLRDKHLMIEKQRDELLVESSRYEQSIQTYEHEIEALTLKNVELKNEIGSLRREIEIAQDRERALQSDFESKHHAVQQSSSWVDEELQRQIQTLARRCEAEKAEKEQLRAALDKLEENARARLEAHNRDQEFLSQFKQQLVNGVVVTKYGSRGNPHTRVLFSDFGCRWISWKPPSSGVSLASPRADAKVETNDLVEVISGATTEVFLRQKPDVPAKCLSLVFVHPCRTLDIEADTLEKSQHFLRGFRLLYEEVSQKRRQHSTTDRVSGPSKVRGATLSSDRARRHLPDARRGVRISVPQPGTGLTPDQPMTQDAAAPVRSTVLGDPERLTLALFARAAPAAGAELIDQVHVVARLPKHRPEALALDGLREPAVLPPFPIPYHAYRFCVASEQFLEPLQETSFRYLATHVAAQLQLSEDVLVVHGAQTPVHLVLFLHVGFEALEVGRLPVVGTQLHLPFDHTLAVDHLLLAFL